MEKEFEEEREKGQATMNWNGGFLPCKTNWLIL